MRLFAHNNSEVRFASGVLAALAFITSCALFSPPNAMDHVLQLVPDNYENWLAWGMLIHSLMLVAAIVRTCRPLRQWGLIIGAMSWFALFGVFLSVWVVRFTALAALVLGCAYFWTLWVDVRKKPRCSL